MAIKYYFLHNAAGMVRNNKFKEAADAICVGSFRAEAMQLPIKVFELHDDNSVVTHVVCNIDGSVEKAKGQGMEHTNIGNQSGWVNESQAHVILSNFDEVDVDDFVTFYLKQPFPEELYSKLEKEVAREVGLIADKAFTLHSRDPKIVQQTEQFLLNHGLELDEVAEASASRALASTEVVSAARKSHKLARAAQLPEFRVKSSSRHGGTFRFESHCEVDKNGKSNSVMVFVNGHQVGNAKSSIEASRIIADFAEAEFKKFLKKELA